MLEGSPELSWQASVWGKYALQRAATLLKLISSSCLGFQGLQKHFSMPPHGFDDAHLASFDGPPRCASYVPHHAGGAPPHELASLTLPWHEPIADATVLFLAHS